MEHLNLSSIALVVLVSISYPCLYFLFESVYDLARIFFRTRIYPFAPSEVIALVNEKESSSFNIWCYLVSAERRKWMLWKVVEIVSLRTIIDMDNTNNPNSITLLIHVCSIKHFARALAGSNRFL